MTKLRPTKASDKTSSVQNTNSTQKRQVPSVGYVICQLSQLFWEMGAVIARHPMKSDYYGEEGKLIP
jgi:hypothetical protein